jgi:hypothetical protein
VQDDGPSGSKWRDKGAIGRKCREFVWPQAKRRGVGTHCNLTNKSLLLLAKEGRGTRNRTWSLDP